MSQANVEIVRRANEAFNRGDIETALTFCAHDIRVEDLMNAPDVPRVVHGAQGLRQLLTAWVEGFEEFRGEIVDYVDEGSHVACVTDYLGKSREGLTLRQTATNVYEFREDKLVQITLGYENLEQALEAHGLHERKMSSQCAEGCVRQIFEGANNRDAAAIQSACDPGFELTSRFSAVEGATYRGHAGIVEYLADLMTAWEDIRWTLEEFIPAGEEKLIVVAHTQGIARGSGVPIDERAYSTWELHQGKALRAHVYTSRDEALKAIGLSGNDNVTNGS